MEQSLKGVILAGGTGARLYPMTRTLNKHLLPVYDKPMIYYPLTTLMLAGVRDILVITTPQDEAAFRRMLGDGAQWGLRLSYAQQSAPRGIAEAPIIAEPFLEGGPCALILGDNVFFGHDLPRHLRAAARAPTGATLFAYRVRDPQRYGVVAFDEAGAPSSLEEKPKAPASDWAVTGIYFFDAEAPRLAKTLTPSARGELEITDLAKAYLARGALKVERMGRGLAWLDTGTVEALHDAAAFIKALETRQGLKVACPEEIALTLGYIGATQVEAIARDLGDCDYARYLRDAVRHHRDGG